MIIDLVRKEVIENGSQSDASITKKILMALAKIVAAGLFIALEVFIYINVDNKVNANSTNGSFDFLILFLFITMLISIIFIALKARKLLFNSFDKTVLSPLPISKGEVVFSKILYLYLIETLTNILISSPILITYFALHNYMPPFYVFGVVYSALISLFEIGITLVLSVVFEFGYRLLKISDIAQFICASIVVIFLCYAYQIVLNLFLDALNANEGTGMFSSSLIELVHRLSISFLPIYTFLDPICNAFNNLASGICITLGMTILSLLLGTIVASYSYTHSDKQLFDGLFAKKRNKNNLVITPFKAMVRKELDLLFKDSSYTFSYTALLIMAPFLSFVVISSLNSIIYQNLRYFSVYFPDLVNGLNVCLILLFSSVINSSAAQSISREGKAIQIVKYIPINPIKQVVAKVLIPICLSSVSLLVSEIVLISTGNIDYKVMLISLFVGLILIVVTTLFGLYLDMHDRASGVTKLSFLNNLLSILFPILILIIHFVISLVRISTFYIYIIEAIVSLFLLIPIFIKPKKVWTNVFRKMEVE